MSAELLEDTGAAGVLRPRGRDARGFCLLQASGSARDAGQRGRAPNGGTGRRDRPVPPPPADRRAERAPSPYRCLAARSLLPPGIPSTSSETGSGAGSERRRGRAAIDRPVARSPARRSSDLSRPAAIAARRSRSATRSPRRTPAPAGGSSARPAWPRRPARREAGRGAHAGASSARRGRAEDRGSRAAAKKATRRQRSPSADGEKLPRPAPVRRGSSPRSRGKRRAARGWSTTPSGSGEPRRSLYAAQVRAARSEASVALREQHTTRPRVSKRMIGMSRMAATLSISSPTSFCCTTSSRSCICSAAVRRSVCMSRGAEVREPPRLARSVEHSRLELLGAQAYLVLEHDRRLEEAEIRALNVRAGFGSIHQRVDDLVQPGQSRPQAPAWPSGRRSSDGDRHCPPRRRWWSTWRRSRGRSQRQSPSGSD